MIWTGIQMGRFAEDDTVRPAWCHRRGSGPNMKELRFTAGGGVWRVAFAFDPERKAIVLVAGDKSEGSEQTFYRRLIALADKRFDHHLAQLKVARARK